MTPGLVPENKILAYLCYAVGREEQPRQVFPSIYDVFHISLWNYSRHTFLLLLAFKIYNPSRFKTEATKCTARQGTEQWWNKAVRPKTSKKLKKKTDVWNKMLKSKGRAGKIWHTSGWSLKCPIMETAQNYLTLARRMALEKRENM